MRKTGKYLHVPPPYNVTISPDNINQYIMYLIIFLMISFNV